MKFRLEPHKKDKDMIEATYTWVNSGKDETTLLAFVIHIDCLEDVEIREEIKNNGEAFVDMKIAP